MKNRDVYMKQLLPFKDKKLIKIVTGMRRCGKSTLLELLKKNLIQNGIHEDAIVHINFESLQFDFIITYRELYNYVKERINKVGKTYVILDEVQQVEKWEKAVNSIMVDFDADVYITGSNAYLLSSELSTLLSGRYVEIKMLPLSFKEFLDFHEFENSISIENKFQEYLKFGGLPSISELPRSDNTVNMFLQGIYTTVIIKDIANRNNIKDMSLLESVVKFIIYNIGNIVSPKRISDVLNSEGRKTTSETIDNYLKMLEGAFIIYSARRYDIKGKQYLKTLQKYYTVDMGLRNALLGYRDADYGHVLENVVYLELLRRNYEVAVGKFGEWEVDFVATKSDEKRYYQVALSINSEQVLERELRPLKLIPDNYEKAVITMDRPFIKSNEGIKYINIVDFLLEG